MMINDFLIFTYGTIIGFMVFFVAVISPTVFKTLSMEAAASFLRLLFPRMFLFGLITSVAGGLLSLLGHNSNSLYASILLVLGFAVNGYVITPKINQARDEFLEGNAEKDRLFKILHTVSVIIFLAQFGLSLFMIGLLSGLI